VAPCAQQCADVLPEACKPAADPELPVEIDLFEYLAILWAPNRAVADGDVLLPPEPNGFALEAQNAGVTGPELPAYRPIDGETFADGSVQWLLIPTLDDGMYVASDPDAEVIPSESGGLEVTELEIAQGRYLRFRYVGGVRGERYEAVFTFTVNAVPRGFSQWVTVT
jgi:hypothetical protein